MTYNEPTWESHNELPEEEQVYLLAIVDGYYKSVDRICLFDTKEKMKGFIDGFEAAEAYSSSDFYTMTEEIAKDEKVGYVIKALKKYRDNMPK